MGRDKNSEMLHERNKLGTCFGKENSFCVTNWLDAHEQETPPDKLVWEQELEPMTICSSLTHNHCPLFRVTALYVCFLESRPVGQVSSCSLWFSMLYSSQAGSRKYLQEVVYLTDAQIKMKSFQAWPSQSSQQSYPLLQLSAFPHTLL